MPTDANVGTPPAEELTKLGVGPDWSVLLSETHDIVTLIGADRRPIWVNPALERVLGYAEVPENFPAAFVHPDDAEQVVKAFDRLVSTGETSTLEYRVRHADGTWRWVEVAVRNRLNDPRIRAVVAVARDITDRRQAAGRGEGRAALDGRVELAEIMERWPRPAVRARGQFSLR